MKRVKVLHADDNSDFLELFVLTFDAWFEITSVRNPFQVLDLISRERYDAVILDYEMPMKNGLEFLREIKELHPKLPVIFYTGQGNEEVAREAFVSGAADYYVKEVFSFAQKEKLINSVRNAVERAKEKEALNQSEMRFRALFQNASDAIFLHRFIEDDKFGATIEVNDAACQLLGYTREEMLGLINRQIIGGENFDDISAVVRRQLVEERKSKFEIVLKAKNGVIIPVEVNSQQFEIEGDRVVMSLVRDITERKKAEEELKTSERLFRDLYEDAPLGYLSLDSAGNCLEVNKAWLDTFGFEKDEVAGRPFTCFLTSQDVAHFKDLFESSNNTEKLNAEFEIECKNKTRLIISFQGKASRDEHGKLKRMHCIFVDVTEQRKARERLQENEQNLIITLNSIGDAVIVTDDRGIITRMNPVAEKLTGWSWSEAQGRPLQEVFNIISEFTGEPAENPYTKVMETGTVVGLANHTALIARDGSIYPIADSGAPIRDSHNRILGVVLVFRDITREVKAKHAVQVTRAALEASSVPFYLIDADARLMSVNQAAARNLGYTKEELLSKKVEDFDPRFTQEAWKRHWNLLKEQKTLIFESINSTRDGMEFPVEITTNYCLIDQKEYALVFAWDLRERKKMESILAEHGIDLLMVEGS